MISTQRFLSALVILQGAMVIDIVSLLVISAEQD